MKKVVLLGDSIRLLGYGAKTADLLGEEYTVWQPEDNCRWAQYTLRMLFDYAAQIENSDVIHWNNGMWDVTDIFPDGHFTPIEQYVETMLRVAKILKSKAKTIIFATTTPVLPTNPYNSNAVIEAYNAAIVPRLQEMGIIINDLYSVIAENLDENICEDKIHLSQKGITVAAMQVEKIIKENC